MSFFAQTFSRLSFAGLSTEVKRESSLTKVDVAQLVEQGPSINASTLLSIIRSIMSEVE